MNKDEIFDIIFWFRQIIGLIIGLVAGILGLTGYIVIVFFIISVFGGSYFYLTKFLVIDEDEFNP